MAVKAIAEEFGLDFIDLRKANVDLTCATNVSAEIDFRHSLIPYQTRRKYVVCCYQTTLSTYTPSTSLGSHGIAGGSPGRKRTEIAKLVKKHLGVGSENHRRADGSQIG